MPDLSGTVTMSTLEDRDPFAFARQGGWDAELFALIAEYRSLDYARKEIRQELDRRESELPRRKAVRVEIGRMILCDGAQEPLYAEDEENLKRHHGLRDTAMGATLMSAQAKAWKHTEIYHDRLDKLIAELRAQNVAADAAHEQARKAAGIAMLSDRAVQLSDRAQALEERVRAVRPTTLTGVVALIDFWLEHRFDGWPEQAIAGLREMAAPR